MGSKSLNGTALLLSRQQHLTVSSERNPGCNMVSNPAGGAQTSLALQVVRASDFGSNDRTFFVKTHLGQLLHPGDTALGYDLSTANLVDPELERCVDKGMPLPDVVLVRLIASRAVSGGMMPSMMHI